MAGDMATSLRHFWEGDIPFALFKQVRTLKVSKNLYLAEIRY
jgi:hypothetical protein